MRVFALCQSYNESAFIRRALTWITPLVNKVIISEGRLTPFGKLPESSTDGTGKIISDFMMGAQQGGKIVKQFSYEGKCNNREQAEGNNKNSMLNSAKKFGLEHGDLIYILDCDEFFPPDSFMDIVDKFKTNSKINHIPIEEWQFAYNMKLAFKAEHNGRFMRYVNGAKFGTTNHFFHPDGKDVTKDYKYLVKRKDSKMCHLCWVKHPKLIREKVISFNRQSFISWYNNCYLVWPENSERAYKNNSKIAPYFGTGFAEGQKNKLETYKDDLPYVLQDIKSDWMLYIIENRKELII